MNLNNLTDRELLNVVDRGNKEVRELAERFDNLIDVRIMALAHCRALESHMKFGVPSARLISARDELSALMEVLT